MKIARCGGPTYMSAVKTLSHSTSHMPRDSQLMRIVIPNVFEAPQKIMGIPPISVTPF